MASSSDRSEALKSALAAMPTEEWEAYLAKECGNDELLRHQIEACLKTRSSDTLLRIVVPGYELCEQIGHGGMGVVYRARDLRFDRDVAIKVLGEKVNADSFAAARFRTEARITGQLQHPGIPPVHDLGKLEDGKPFLAMKLVKGQTLRKLLQQRSSPGDDLGRFIAIFEQVCHAIGYAHAHRVIHRDLKPSNVMVGKFGEVQVMDWGLAKVLGESTSDQETVASEDASTQAFVTSEIDTPDGVDSATQTGSVLGTPAYMAPEQAGGQIRRLDARSDVFGLGAILCEILTGRPPYAEANPNDVRIMAVRGDLEQAFKLLDHCTAESDLVALAKKSMSFKQDDRPPDGQALADEVARIRTESDNRARLAERERSEALIRESESKKQRKQFVLAASVIGVVLILGIVGTVAGLVRAQYSATAERKAKLEAKAKQKEAEEERLRAEQREKEAIDAVNRFGDAVARNPELKNSEQLKSLRKELLKEPLAFFKLLRQRLQNEKSTQKQSLARLASAACDLGKLTDEIGDKRDAISIYEEAIVIQEQLARENPTVPQFAAELATSHSNLGNLHSDTGNPSEAMAAYEESKRIRERIVRENPTNPGFACDLARSYGNLGNLLRDTGKPDKGLAAYEECSKILQQLILENPTVAEYQRFLALCHQSRGILLHRAGKLAEALAAMEESTDAFKRLASENPTVAEFAEKLAGSYGRLGILLSHSGKLTEARAAYEEAKNILSQLSKENSSNTGLAFELAAINSNLGKLLSDTGMLTESQLAIEEAISIQKQLVSGHPNVTGYLSDLAISQLNLGNSLQASGKLDDALIAYEESKRNFAQLANKFPRNTQFAGDLAASQEVLSQVLARSSRIVEALDALQEAAKIRKRLVRENPSDAKLAHELAASQINSGNLLSELGKPTEAMAANEASRDILDRLVRENPSVAQFQGELGATLNNIAQLELDAQHFLEAKKVLLRAIDYQKQALTISPNAPVYREFLQNHYTNLIKAAKGLKDEVLEVEAQKYLQELNASDPRLAALDQRAAAILGGETAKNCDELLALGHRSFDLQKFAFAARCYGEAMEREPAIAENRQLQIAYNAACCAALAASGRSLDQPPPDDASKAKLRLQALKWLKSELQQWEKEVERPESRKFVGQLIKQWQIDGDLASVREPTQIGKLPENERGEWEALWAKVKALEEKANFMATPERNSKE